MCFDCNSDTANDDPTHDEPDYKGVPFVVGLTILGIFFGVVYAMTA